jgi:hypothetical protein
MSDESGIATGNYSYMNVRASTSPYFTACTTTELNLLNGSATEGTWSLSCVIPLDAPNLSYDLEIHISDVNSNQVGLNILHAFVLTGGSNPEYVPPKILSIALSDDIVEWGDTLEVQVHAADSQSGVKILKLQAYEPYFTYIVICTTDMTLISGNGADGYWSSSCVIPYGIDQMMYNMDIYAYDEQNNESFKTVSFKVVAPAKTE